MAVDESTASDEESAAPPLPEPETELVFGAGQSAWLALVTLGVIVSLVVSFVALFLALDDDGDGVTPPAGPAGSLTVEASEFAFDPASATIAAAADVDVTLDNVGAIEHNWTVLDAGVRISDEADFDESTVVAQITALAGSSSADSVNLAAGSYQVICTIAGHFSAGMEASLEVTG